MKTSLFVIFSLLPILIFGQFEATLYGSLGRHDNGYGDPWSSYGIQLELNHVPNDYFAIGLFGGFTKYENDNYIRNHLSSTGLLVEGRGRFDEQMKIIPIINGSMGYCKEYTRFTYTYGENDQIAVDTWHQNGIYMSLRLGIISNFEKLSPFDFKTDIGLIHVEIEPLNIFSTGSHSYLQYRFGAVYNF